MKKVKIEAELIKTLLPFFAAVAVSIVVLPVYIFALGRREAVKILQACVAPLVALVLPLFNRIFKIRLPLFLNAVVTAHAVVALDFAAVLGLYEVVPCMDKLLHTFFGFEGALAATVFLFYVNGEKLKPVGFFLVIFLAVMGLGALWEIFEFAGDSLFGNNAQIWRPAAGDAGLSFNEYLAKYGSPLNDTMWDLIVTMFGILAFDLMVLIDKLCGFKLMKGIYKKIKGEGETIIVESNSPDNMAA